MNELCGESTADGRDAFRPAKTVANNNEHTGGTPGSDGVMNIIDPELADLSMMSSDALDLSDDELELAGSGKRNATSAKLDADSTGQGKKARTRKTTSGGLELLGQSINELSQTLKEDTLAMQTIQQGDVELDRFQKAVKMIETDEDIESDGECCAAVKAVTSDPDRIKTYLSFTRKGARKHWLNGIMQEELDKV